VRQEDGAALDNLVLEIWQADAKGVYRHPADPREERVFALKIPVDNFVLKFVKP